MIVVRLQDDARLLVRPDNPVLVLSTAFLVRTRPEQIVPTERFPWFTTALFEMLDVRRRAFLANVAFAIRTVVVLQNSQLATDFFLIGFGNSGPRVPSVIETRKAFGRGYASSIQVTHVSRPRAWPPRAP